MSLDDRLDGEYLRFKCGRDLFQLLTHDIDLSAYMKYLKVKKK